MIYGGTLPGEQPLDVKLTVDTDQFVAYVTRVAREMTVLDVTLEVIGMTPDQVWATFYVRGAMDPEFADPAAVDLYVNALLKIRGERGEAARNAFLRGWAEHRSVPASSPIWHRHIGDTSIQLGPAA